MKQPVVGHKHPWYSSHIAISDSISFSTSFLTKQAPNWSQQLHHHRKTLSGMDSHEMIRRTPRIGDGHTTLKRESVSIEPPTSTIGVDDHSRTNGSFGATKTRVKQNQFDHSSFVLYTYPEDPCMVYLPTFG